MTEEKINEFLRLTLKTYFDLQKSGKKELASQVLKTGSILAEFMLGTYNVVNNCPQCGKQVKKGQETEFLNKIGECLICDHIRSDEHSWSDYMNDIELKQ